MDEFLYNKALKFLARRPRSEKEVHDNLFKKYIRVKLTPEQKEKIESKIDAVIIKLREQKYLDDTEFAKWWIEQRDRFRPKGWQILALELKQKGISVGIIRELENKSYDLREKSEKEMAKDLIQKHMKKFQGLSRQELYQKLGGFLARRGFDLDVIPSCIDEVLRK